MVFLLIVSALILALLYLFNRFKGLPPKARKKQLLTLSLYGIAALIAVLAVTGRVHWIIAAVSMLVALLRPFLGIAISALPAWLLSRRLAKKEPQQQKEQTASASPASGRLTQAEAADILGLKAQLESHQLTKELINSAHRALIQKVHPDRGGNEYLASRVNTARDILLKSLS